MDSSESSEFYRKQLEDEIESQARRIALLEDENLRLEKQNLELKIRLKDAESKEALPPQAPQKQKLLSLKELVSARKKVLRELMSLEREANKFKMDNSSTPASRQDEIERKMLVSKFRNRLDELEAKKASAFAQQITIPLARKEESGANDTTEDLTLIPISHPYEPVNNSANLSLKSLIDSWNSAKSSLTIDSLKVGILNSELAFDKKIDGIRNLLKSL